MDFAAKEPTCPEGLTFYDLRPYFTAFYYGSKELSDEIQAHLAACGACAKKWKFLERTDPQVSDWYSRQVDVLAEDVVALEAVPYEMQTPGAVQTPSGEQPAQPPMPWTQIPGLEEIRKGIEEVWSPAADEETRYQRAQALVEASKGALIQASGQALEALARFMPLFQDNERREPIPIGSVELLFLTNFVWTSLYPGVVEFLPDGTCCCYPLQFRQARMRFEAALHAHAPAELPTGK